MISKRVLQLIAAASLSLLLGACAHDIKPAEIPMTANPRAEVDNLTASVDAARNQNLDVLAPQNFKNAEHTRCQVLFTEAVLPGIGRRQRALALFYGCRTFFVDVSDWNASCLRPIQKCVSI